MAEKKRRTELDIDDDLLAPREEAVDAPPAPPEEPEAPPVGSKEETPSRWTRKKLLIVGGLALGGMLVTAVGVWGTLTYMTDEPKPIPTETPTATIAPTPPPPPPPATAKPIAPTYSFEPFIIPIRQGADVQFITLSLAVEMSGPEVEKEIERNLVLVRENIFTVLERARLEDLREEEKRRKLLIEVAIAVNRSIQAGAVMNTMVTGMVTH